MFDRAGGGGGGVRHDHVTTSSSGERPHTVESTLHPARLGSARLGCTRRHMCVNTICALWPLLQLLLWQPYIITMNYSFTESMIG